MPLLKSSLALLHILICFTTGHKVPGLQSFPISFRNITIPSGAPPHTPDFSAWQRTAHNGHIHFKNCHGIGPSSLTTTRCTEQEKPLQLYASTVKRWGNVIFMKTKLETRGFSYLRGHEEPLGSCQYTAAAPCSGCLLPATPLL